MMTGKWFPSELNSAPEIVSQMNLPAKVIPFDCTLREGEDTPGVRMTIENKVNIARALEKLGVPELEIGCCGYIEEHAQVARVLKKEGMAIKLASLIRMWSAQFKKEIDECANLGIDILELCGGASDYQRAFSNLSRGQYLDRMVEATEYAKTTGLEVNFYPVDSVRTDLNYLKTLLRYGVAAGAHRVHVSDTLGNATPIATRFFVQEVKKVVKEVPVQYHCHNDFGMAVANTCAAVEGGAEVLDLVINGLGVRSGNTNFQETIMALTCLYGVETGIKTEKLYETCRLVEEITKFKLEDNKPIVGKLCFTHESDVHVQAILRGLWSTFEPFQPEVVGQKRSIYFGYTTSPESVKIKAQKMGIDLTVEQTGLILGRIKQRVSQKGYLVEEEVEELIKSL